MNNRQLNEAINYRIELKGRVDVEWLQYFDSSVEIKNVTGQMGDMTVITVHTDQSGVVGLLRKLHGLGMTILEVQIVPEPNCQIV